jgi:hypothetical protein
MKSKGRPPKLTQEQYSVIVSVREARAQIPTDSDLASQLEISIKTIKNAMRRGIKLYDSPKI